MSKDTVSWSEISTWCQCRQKWYWAYELRIVPKQVSRSLSLGSCGHAALAAHLEGKDWLIAIEEWASKQVQERPMYDEEMENVGQLCNTVRALVQRYLEDNHDQWKVLEVEKQFEIGVRGLKHKLIGFWDAIVQDADGHKWILEHKFVKQFRTEDQLLLDGQIGVYQYAARRMGHDIIGTIYDQVLTKIPAVPAINKNNTVSRAAIATDWETYKRAVIAAGQNPDDYLDMKEKLADNVFSKRIYIYRPRAEVDLFARDMERRIWDIKKAKKHIYHCESHINCMNCPYRELCIEQLKGGDVGFLIEMNFEPKREREEAPENATTEPSAN